MLRPKQKQIKIEKNSLRRFWGLAKRLEQTRIKGKRNKDKSK
jgi:hypothetical protein